MNSIKLFLGVAAGIAAGAWLGVLLAPDKGTQTRKKIINKGEDIADELKEKFDQFVDTVSMKYENNRQEDEGLVSNGRAR